MNPEHYNLLKSSIGEFNKWRAANWNLHPDLSGANLRGMNLHKANLNHANLSGADLREAILISVEARSADLEQADLTNAQLQNANFSMANFTRATLRGANLTGSFLQDCCLLEADLTNSVCICTKFRNSNLVNATFYHADVKGATFEGTNVDEANIYYEQFKDANVPLELMGSMEKKTSPRHYIFYTFISFAIVFIIFFVIHRWISTATEPGALNTKIRAGIHYRLGQTCIILGLHKSAINNLEVTARLDPKNARIHVAIGDAYRELNDEDKAYKHYKKFMELDPDAESAGPIREFIYRYEEGAKKRKRR